MGAHYTYACDRCGYAVEVSGKADFGYTIETATVICLDCRALVDMVTGSCAKKSDPDIGVCPLCRGSRIAEWDAARRPCPRCEGRMIKGELAALWD